MKSYHVVVEQAEDGWLAAHAVEDESVHTQGRTLDEVAANIREVAELLRGERDVQVELTVPSSVTLAAEHA
ncbi:MAG: type II toxin-antitoxin system HicB family antitoxin [Lacipirellulaceae bacterium]